MNLPERPITILIAALGGEGGGVMADWLMEAATSSGYPAQATSIPGVAQRTGATTYYLEIYPAKRELLKGKEPVLSLTPSPGNVDVMVQARDYMDELGVHVEACTSEASAAAMLGASINYPARGAVTWKSFPRSARHWAGESPFSRSRRAPAMSTSWSPPS